MDKQVTNVFELDQPNIQTIPLVFSSPHSGREYTDDFVTTSKLDRLTLRRSEDSFVDEQGDTWNRASEYGDMSYMWEYK